MPTLYNQIGVTYDDPTIAYDGKKSNLLTIQSSLSLSSERRKRISQLLKDAEIAISSRPVTSLSGNGVASLSLNSLFSRLINLHRIRTVTAILSSKFNKRLAKFFASEMSLSGGIIKREGHVREAEVSLSSSMSFRLLRVLKADFNAGLSLSASMAKGQNLVAKEATLILTAFNDEQKRQAEIINLGIFLIDLEARKAVGKNIKTREHAPSTWHSF